MRPAANEIHIWQARLDAAGWPAADGLPAGERQRAAEMLRDRARERWVAARWVLRGVLGSCLDADPEAIELRTGEHGKPLLARPDAPLRFNLSHSGEVALVAVSAELEVGVDVEWIGKRPASFYAAWSRSEATVKCHGTGLGQPVPDAPVSVTELDAGPRFAAAVAVAGEARPALRHLTIEPGDLAGR